MQCDAAKAQLYTGTHGKGMVKICGVLLRRSIATNGKGMEVRRVATAKQREARQWRGLVSRGAGGKAMAKSCTES